MIRSIIEESQMCSTFPTKRPTFILRALKARNKRSLQKACIWLQDLYSRWLYGFFWAIRTLRSRL
jgi:hypothetical protein